jgi:methylmalonyl-CoA mutase
MTDLNFSEFSESSFENWMQLVQKELGERSINMLDWEVEEGVVVGPYQSSTEKNYSLNYSPTQVQYQLISHSDPKQWNRLALDSLMGGTNALGVDCSSLSPEMLPTLLAGIEVKYISIHFVNVMDGAAWAIAFKQYCDDHSIDCSQLTGSFSLTDMSTSTEEMKKWQLHSRAHFPRFRTISIDAAHIHEQGGSIIHELAWALTAGHHALSKCMESGASIDEASACMQFNFAMGSSYFPQIAKLRAFRWMWKRIIEAYNPEHACSVNTFIHASTSRYLQTGKDKHNNLLRATTQTMSAYVGGANSVSVVPYNSWQEQADESALRWARNIQQLLVEESYFGQYTAVADGAYYIEQLTDQLVGAAWKQFQTLDAIAVQESIQRARAELAQAIEAFASKQRALIQDGKRVIVGVNRYVNKTDSAVVDEHAQTLSAPFEKA